MTDDPLLRKARVIVACFDGTSNSYSEANTNVVQLFSLLKIDDPERQVCYYQPGIGTYFKPGVVKPSLEFVAKLADEAVAWYLNQHVMDGYQFLMNNWRAGDKICIFGFSRGSYTARALAGLLNKIGLLSKDNWQQILFGYKLFQRTDPEGVKLAAGFKKTFSRDVQIDFLGVWDTVASVGVIVNKTLPFTDCNQSIKTFRHALSLDEHRAKFRPTFYQDLPCPPDNTPTEVVSDKKRDSLLGKLGVSRTRTSQGSDIKHEEHECWKRSDVLEVWFAGDHSDVGGGAVPDDTPHALSNVSLRWMLQEIVKSQCGIVFTNEAINQMGYTLPGFLNLKGSNHEKEDQDINALQPQHDSLNRPGLLWFWWIVEVIPFKWKWHDETGKLRRTYKPNFGNGRLIPPNANFHISVKHRLEDPTLNYKHRAKFMVKGDGPTYVY